MSPTYTGINDQFRNELLTTVITFDKNTFPWGSGVQICNGKWEGMLTAKLPEPVIVISTV